MSTTLLGAVWQLLRDPSSFDLRDAAHGPGDLWVLVGDGGGSTYEFLTISGADAANGVPSFASVTPSGSDLNSVDAGLSGLPESASEIFVAVGDAGIAYESPDGLVWTPVAIPASPSLNAVRAGFVGLGFSFVAAGDKVMFRSALGTWTAGSGSPFPPSGGEYHALATTGETTQFADWIVVGESPTNGAINQSTNAGITWGGFYTQGTNKLFAADYGITSGVYLIGGENGQIWRSPSGDPGSWVDKSITGAGDIRTIQYLGEMNWFASGSPDDFWVSQDDGDSWLNFGPGTGIVSGSGIDTGRGGLMTAGDDGRIYVSFSETLTTGSSLTKNENYISDALGRLISQFRG